ncbi:MAG TPA: DNA methyltransferase [Ktedonobacteraceae bacterium]|nr:DNA methyltransferase [Ktedonobacteraceae bacterium]
MPATSHPLTTALYLGNALDILPTLKDDSVDLICTDPPYGIDYRSRSHSLPLTKIMGDKGKEAHELLDNVLSLASKKLKPDRHLYIFTNWQAFEGMAPVVKKYFKLKGALAWIKNNRTRGDLKGNYGYQYEMVLYAHKGRRWLFGKRDSDILHFDKVPTQAMQHPTEKPVKLLQYLIEKSTQPGEIILDPFMGSGSTGEAASQAGRGFIGIEMEPAWFAVAKKRLGEPSEQS